MRKGMLLLILFIGIFFIGVVFLSSHEKYEPYFSEGSLDVSCLLPFHVEPVVTPRLRSVFVGLENGSLYRGGGETCKRVDDPVVQEILATPPVNLSAFEEAYCHSGRFVYVDAAFDHFSLHPLVQELARALKEKNVSFSFEEGSSFPAWFNRRSSAVDRAEWAVFEFPGLEKRFYLLAVYDARGRGFFHARLVGLNETILYER